MYLIKFAVSSVLGLAALIVALKIVGIFLFVVGLVAKLMWMLVVVGFLALVGWVIYKLLAPQHPEQI